MRDERVMAASINATYSRPEKFKPSCGTSDPGIMQVTRYWQYFGMLNNKA